MIVKEHDIINFSMNVEVGACRYYNKEVFCKEGLLIVKIDDKDIPLSKIFHIEIVGVSDVSSCGTVCSETYTNNR